MRLHPSCRLDVWHGPAAPGADGRFEAVREQHAALPARPRCSRELWHRTSFQCHGERKTAMECASCEHFLNLAPDRDRCGATLRCLFLDDDRVDALMTPVAKLVSVPVRAPMAEAAVRAQAAGVRQVAITHDDEIVAMVDPRRGERVTPVAAVPSDMPLAALARLFRRTRLQCLLVMAADQVAGVITAGDLLRAGVPGVIASI